jgi:hypothetical protein
MPLEPVVQQRDPRWIPNDADHLGARHAPTPFNTCGVPNAPDPHRMAGHEIESRTRPRVQETVEYEDRHIHRNLLFTPAAPHECPDTVCKLDSRHARPQKLRKHGDIYGVPAEGCKNFV